ncbi:MAG: helix-turn-helix transcriptional regulator [Chloroflexi bacterium]|nr:helix-turn-helix transcriptional regulator [Chloroflexota bacterium]
MSPTRAQPTPEDLAAVKVYKALGDSNRFTIVRMLVQQGELGCEELRTALGLTAPALSHHLRILQECGLLALRREGPFHFFLLHREQLERFAPSLLAPLAKVAS